MMWVWVVLGVLAALEAGVVAELEQEKRRGDRYEPRHLSGAELGALAGRNWYGRRLLPPAPGVHHERDFYGSMTLAEERGWYCTPGCPDDVCRAMGECAWQPEPSYLPADPVPYEDLQSDARVEDDRDGTATAAWFHELGEDPGPGVDRPPPPGPVQDDCLIDCDPDCESGQRHCWWIHQPSHKRGWHSLADCPHTQLLADAEAFLYGQPEPTQLATAADVGAARPWLDVQREWLDGQYREFYAWYRGVLAA